MIMLKKVKAGENGIRRYSPSMYKPQKYPEDGVILVVDGQPEIYIRARDLRKLKAAKYGKNIKIDGWEEIK